MAGYGPYGTPRAPRAPRRKRCRKCGELVNRNENSYSWIHDTCRTTPIPTPQPSPDTPEDFSEVKLGVGTITLPSPDKIRRDDFESMGELLQYLDTTPRVSNIHHSETGASDWTQTDSYEEAIGLARDGWSDIRPEVEAILDSVDAEYRDRYDTEFIPTFDVSGAEVDIDRFLTGEPECMIESALVGMPRKGKVIRILVSGSASSGVPADAIRQRGVIVVALVETLKRLGLSPELYVEFAVKGGYNQASLGTTLVKVHDAASTTDIDEIMFAVAHPSMLRRVMFAVWERWEGYFQLDSWSTVYGYPHEPIRGAEIDADLVMPTLSLDDYGPMMRDGAGYMRKLIEHLGLTGEVVS